VFHMRELKVIHTDHAMRMNNKITTAWSEVWRSRHPNEPTYMPGN
jgi:hypothetical protein